MNLFVTGGCGFIGANFVRYVLKRESTCRVLNLDKLTYAGNLASLAGAEEAAPGRYRFVHGDIGDHDLVAALFAEQAFDAVINFAAESHVDRSIADPTLFVTTNVMGTQVLLSAAFAAGIPRFVHISTDEVYGSLGPDDAAFTEKTPLAPNSPYSASKAGADFLVHAFHETYGMNTVITRCSNNYGPYQFPEKLIPLMLRRASRDESLPVYGDGGNIRDWIHVEDHCLGVYLALTKGSSGAVYNFGGHAERTNIEVVRTLLGILGKSESLIRFVQDRPGHDRRYAMDYSLAEKELGYAPKWKFSSGLAATAEWYAQNTAWLDGVESGAYRNFMQAWYGNRL
ncbi:MAG: dTDP-glucose 4,6-dehydratase [Betaproteobacteria bacterium]|nr:dTDP-glucose 4,6-dehydratase [Betaproteobacteria bacterium]